MVSSVWMERWRRVFTGGLIEDDQAQHIAERGVAHFPLRDARVLVRGKEAAVVAGDASRAVALGIRAVDEVEGFQQRVVAIGEGVVGEICAAFQLGHEPGKAVALSVDRVAAMAARLDWQKAAALRVEDEKEAVEEDERRLIKRGEVGGRDVVFRVRAIAGGEVFEHIEDAVLEVFFECDLPGEGFLAELVEQAAFVLPLKGGGPEQRDEKAKVVERAKRFAVRERELEERIARGLLAVEPPARAVGEDGPVEKARARGVLRVAEVVLDLLAGEPAGRFAGRRFVERVLPAFGFEDGFGEVEDVRGVRSGGGLLAARGVAGQGVVGALARGAVREVCLGDEVPAERGEQRVEEGGARVGFLLLDEAGELFLPQRACLAVEALDFRHGRKVGGACEVALEVVRGEDAVAVKRAADFLAREGEVELVRVRIFTRQLRQLCAEFPRPRKHCSPSGPFALPGK